MKRWLQFTFLLLTASALAHVPETKVTSRLDDLNGYLVQAKDTQHSLAYDDENRLAVFTKYSAMGVPSTKSELQYDGLSRLRVRREYTWVPDNKSSSPQGGGAAPQAGGGGGGSGTWQLSSETRYVYDGMRVLQERNGSNVPLVSYTRGKDLSGSLGGAGGIGGLLARSHGYNGGSGAWSTNNFHHADGGGNITYLLAANQTMAASYRYDPYGNQTYSSGSLAAANVYRFSSKEVHLNSGLYAYGYRFYSPNWQRWLNQDPIGEWGGINLYGAMFNSPLNYVDRDGLDNMWAPGTGQNAPPAISLTLGYLPTRPPGLTTPGETVMSELYPWEGGGPQIGSSIDRRPYQEGLTIGFNPNSPLREQVAESYAEVYSLLLPIKRIKWCPAAESGALTKVPNFANSRLAAEHYAKHVKGVVDKGGMQTVSPFGTDMAEFASFKDYVQVARKFNSGPTPSGVLDGVRANGDLLRFDPVTGNFGITTPQGTIRTFFRPSEGVDYFYKQFK